MPETTGQRRRRVAIVFATFVGLMTASAALSVAWAGPNTYVIRPPQQAAAVTPQGKPLASPPSVAGAKRVNIPDTRRGGMAGPSAGSNAQDKVPPIDPARPPDKPPGAVGTDRSATPAETRAITAVPHTGDVLGDGQYPVNGTFEAMSLAAARPPARQGTASAPTSDSSRRDTVPGDPRSWSSAAWPPRVAYSAQRIAPSTVGMRRVLANGDAGAALANIGIDADTARSAAWALAAIAPATLDRRSASIELVHGRTEDGDVRLLSATILDRKSRGQVWWFAPKGKSEGFFDDHGNRVGDPDMAMPIPGSQISSPFGTRYGGPWASFHNGIDVAGSHGTPIIAAADGVVDYAGWYYDYGKTLRIIHSDSLATSYSHMSDFAPGIGPGTRVQKGQVIGYVGSTGRSTGPHLHFCVLVDGGFVNPATFVSGDRGRLGPKDMVSFRAWQRAAAAMAKEARPDARGTLAKDPGKGVPLQGRTSR